MTGIEKRRQAFAEGIRETVSSADERARFMRALDTLVAWSEAQGSILKLRDDYEQGVVAYGRVADGAVLWSAYPREKDGAKLEILPRSLRKQPALVRERIDAVLATIGSESPNAEDLIMIPFVKLKNASKLSQVTQLLAELTLQPA